MVDVGSFDLSNLGRLESFLLGCGVYFVAYLINLVVGVFVTVDGLSLALSVILFIVVYFAIIRPGDGVFLYYFGGFVVMVLVVVFILMLLFTAFGLLIFIGV